MSAASRFASRMVVVAAMLFLSATAPSRLAHAGSGWQEVSQVGDSPYLHTAPAHRAEAEPRTHRRAAPSVDVPEAAGAVVVPATAAARRVRVHASSDRAATILSSHGYDATAPPVS